MSKSNLELLEQNIKRDFKVLEYPSRSGVSSQTGVVNVAIIGGGQSALALAGALMQEKIEGIEIYEKEEEAKVGPWPRFARMHTLRTPKNLPGPNLGVPNLTIPRWYEAIHGEGSWEKVGLIPKEDWTAYLRWYRQTLNLPVSFLTEVESVEWNPEEELFFLQIDREGKQEIRKARRVVLASGIEGSGNWHIPDFIKEALPKEVYAHTSEDIDFSALKGKRIGVLGAGASAFDNASVCLESGAASVDLCFRRKELVKQNTFRWSEYMGFLKHFPDLNDDDKWRFIHKILEIGQLPPRDTFNRATQFEEFHLCPDTPWDKVRYDDGEVIVQTKGRELKYDFVIVATGFKTDLSLRKELASFSDKIALWSDFYTPPKALKNDDMSRHPYLDDHFQHQPKPGIQAPWINRVYNYTYGGLVSLGFGGASITGMKYSLQRIVYGITCSFFLEEKEEHYESLCDYREQEF